MGIRASLPILEIISAGVVDCNRMTRTCDRTATIGPQQYGFGVVDRAVVPCTIVRMRTTLGRQVNPLTNVLR